MAVFQRILVATDGSPACDGAVERAVELASCLGAELVVLSVAREHDIDPADLDSASDPLGAAEEAHMALSHRVGVSPVEAALSRALAAVERAGHSGVSARPIVWEGAAGESILAAAGAEAADLIVVGSHCRGGVQRLLLGSVSDQIVRHARVPVLVVRPVAAEVAEHAS